MHTENALQVLSLLFLGSVTTATLEARRAQQPDARVEEARAGWIEAGVPLEFGVIGLTKDNLEKVQQSLTAMMSQVYVCDNCKREEAAPGKCPQCGLELKVKREALLLDAVVSLETASIRVTPLAERTLRFSTLAGALSKNAVEIDTAKFQLAGKSLLVLRGGTPEDSKAIEKALLDSRLFDLVKAEYDPLSSETRVQVQARATPPMHSEVVAIIDALGTKAKLTDVIWGSNTGSTEL